MNKIESMVDDIQIEFDDICMDENMKCSKLEYLSEYVFDFITYDSELSKTLGLMMIEVIQAIVDKQTFEYIKISDANYVTYITMINMPFLKNKLSWGTSIRGAWIESDGFERKCKAILKWYSLQ